MPEIEITPEQEERLRGLQEEIARDVVGKYGHVRPRDAVEYLLDRYENDDDADPAGERVEAAGGETAATAGGDDAADAGGPDDTGTTDGSDDGPATDADGGGDPDADAAATDGEGATARVVADDGGGGDAMLDEMMSLLDTHEDKWGESSGDERYAVELPDGSSEQVRTKDDVKALLFKHYR